MATETQTQTQAPTHNEKENIVTETQTQTQAPTHNEKENMATETQTQTQPPIHNEEENMATETQTQTQPPTHNEENMATETQTQAQPPTHNEKENVATETQTQTQPPTHNEEQDMATENQTQTQPPTHNEEGTFRHFTPDQAKAYAAGRSSYHENLYTVICGQHAATGGAFGTLMDVGCGPGNSTRPLAKRFETAYGTDPSPEMINTAKALSAESQDGETTAGKKIEFVVARAEDVGGAEWKAGDKVDLLTAGMAAHWFDMAEFWASAARVLNKGGTVALWTAHTIFPHPATPNAAHVKETFFRLEHEYLDPYESEGNRIARSGYDLLTLPWDVDPPTEGFAKDGFTRLVWDRDGNLSYGNHFFLGDQHITLAQLQKKLGTTSMVTRWRDAHPHLANTDEDVVVKMAQEAREAIGGEELIVGNSCSLLLFKKT